MVNFLTEAVASENLTKWLLRVVVTLVIAAVWHYYCSPPAVWSQTQHPSSSSSGSTTSANVTPAKSRLLREIDPVPNELALEETVEAVVTEKKEVEKKERLPAKETQDKSPPMKLADADASNTNTNTTSRPIKDEKSPEKRQRDRPTPSTASPASASLVQQQHQNQQQQQPPPFQGTTNEHPGLQAFWDWCNVETSLFRIYTIGRTDNVPVVPPYNPSSRRGQVSVHLRVTNGCSDRTIAVYWVNFKGREEKKGDIRPDSVWVQTTWMEHPWVFRDAATDLILVHYIPYRILPTLADSPTVDPEDPTVGLHQFTIRPPKARATPVTTSLVEEEPFIVSIEDPTLPFPAEDYLKTPTACIAWTLMHCRRMMDQDATSMMTLTKYLTKIVQYPDDSKFRQIRIANPVFSFHIWQTAARGLLLAVGFVERGAHVELGSGRTALSRDRVQDVALLLFQVEQSQLKLQLELQSQQTGNSINSNAATAVTRQQQPVGADGFGRAGWGRADGMNVPDS